jgi:hypothetical protein
MDYCNIGAIGFAQFGTDEYYLKKTIEKKVLEEFIKQDEFKIPEEFEGMCFYIVKSFPYEGDSYNELCLAYHENVTDSWSIAHDDLYEATDFDNHEDEDYFSTSYSRFWEFVNKSETIDLETDELMMQCKKLYSMKVIHKKNDNNDEEDNINLKAI